MLLDQWLRATDTTEIVPLCQHVQRHTYSMLTQHNASGRTFCSQTSTIMPPQIPPLHDVVMLSTHPSHVCYLWSREKNAVHIWYTFGESHER